MSAIYGAIDLSQNVIDKELPAKFDAEYSKCKIDKNNSLIKDNVYMHCGVQYFYPRAVGEKLPIYDGESNLYITADCVIDNRKELLPELSLDDADPDGDLILAAYKKWGKKCCEHLQGLYSFVIYDEKKNEIFAAVDQFAQRCLFYHVRDGVFYFSTLFFPIPKATELEFEENERWLVDTVSIRGPVMISEPKETAFNGILKIVSGTYITVSLVEGKEIKIEDSRYYDPYHTIPTDWSITREQSLEMTRKVLADTVERILEGQDKVASQLSSGLDSSSVACNAARILDKSGKKLYSFTSIPLKEANLDSSGYLKYDETEGVKKICESYSNIEPTFVECKDRDFLIEAREIINKWELPCKSNQNSIWIDEISRVAAEKGCRIMLNGATGNCTLSAGRIRDVAYFYFTKCKMLKAYHIFDGLKEKGVSRKRLLQSFVEDWSGYYLWYFDKNKKNYYNRNVTQRSVGEKYNLLKRFQKNNMHYYPFKTMDKMRQDFYMVKANAQIGELDVKGSLMYGILLRDPMRTVPVINMCFKLPITCFAAEDYDRRLLREGMKGIVPDEILSDMFHRGRQSGDNRYRVSRDLPQMITDIKNVIYSPLTMHFLDKNKLDEIWNRVSKEFDKASDDNVLLLEDIYSFGLYLEKMRNVTKKIETLKQ